MVLHKLDRKSAGSGSCAVTFARHCDRINNNDACEAAGLFWRSPLSSRFASRPTSSMTLYKNKYMQTRGVRERERERETWTETET